MPTLNVTKTYADNEILVSNDIDNIIDSLESFINNVKLDDQNIQDNSITTANLADGAVEEAQLAADAITTAKIADNAITSDKFAPGSVAADALVANTITTAKIADNTFSRSLTPAIELTESSEINVTGLTDGVWTTVATINITATAGRPVIFMLNSAGGSSGQASITIPGMVTGTSGTSNTLYSMGFRLRADSTTISEFSIGAYRNTTYMSAIGLGFPAPGIIHIDTSLSGSYTITLQANPSDHAGIFTGGVVRLKLVALEVRK